MGVVTFLYLPCPRFKTQRLRADTPQKLFVAHPKICIDNPVGEGEGVRDVWNFLRMNFDIHSGEGVLFQELFFFKHDTSVCVDSYIKDKCEKQRHVQAATKRAGEEGKVAAPLPIPINDDSWRCTTTWHQHCPSIAPNHINGNS